jgi:hypothetical protein
MLARLASIFCGGNCPAVGRGLAVSPSFDSYPGDLAIEWLRCNVRVRKNTNRSRLFENRFDLGIEDAKNQRLPNIHDWAEIRVTS